MTQLPQIEVECKATEPEAPEAPEATEIPTEYIVSCLTDKNNHASEQMNLLPDTFTIGEVTKDGETYVCPITIATEAYAKAYSELYGEHTAKEASITFNMTRNGQEWVAPAMTQLPQIEVECTIEQAEYAAVIFDSGKNGSFAGGKTTVTASVEKGELLQAAQIPTVYPDADYIFAGWLGSDKRTYTTQELQRLVITGDMTFTALYNYNGDQTQTQTQTYTLKYDTNGGEKIASERNKAPWTKAYGTLPMPVRTGYIFDGWYYDSACTDRVREDVEVNQATVTLYAGWLYDAGDPHNTGVADLLETEKHIQYLYGYPDGSFGCDRNMTRAEAAQMFYNLLLDKDVKKTITFTDVKGDEWYADAVYAMATLGVLKGYPDGTFQPDRAITRAEFTTMGMQFSHLDTSEENLFKDVSSSDWFHSFVLGASKYGWISGYPDGTFKPNDNVTRAEVTCLVNNMLGRSADESFVDRNSAKLNSFTDLTKSYWAYYPIMEAANGHDWRANNGAEIWTKLL